MTNKSGWLYEISFMRPILLVLLVSYHAFAPYSGAWEMPQGIEANETYKWLAYISRSFRLEAFVFLSGYVFTMQIVKKQKFKSLFQLAFSKFKRLIIPCWIFGIVYYLLFSRGQSLFLVFSGIAHLWYLPCLFWCSLAIYLTNNLEKKYGVSEKILLALFIACMAISVIYIPLQLNKALYYCFFFYLGGIFWKHNSHLTSKTNAKTITVLVISYIALLIFVNLFNESHANAGMVYKIIKVMLKAILATTGITMLYFIASMYTQKHTLNKTVMTIGTMGYGVYVFHQFILKYLYYYTALPQAVGSAALPWIALVGTIILSLLLTQLFRSTKVGRALI